jgi:phosphoesterase RecJ-like protein
LKEPDLPAPPAVSSAVLASTAATMAVAAAAGAKPPGASTEPGAPDGDRRTEHPGGDDGEPGLGAEPIEHPTQAQWAAAVAALRALPPDASVLLACHVNPDGDALGSMLGVALGLRGIAGELGIGRLAATFPGRFELPEPFVALPGVDLLVAEPDADPAPDAVLAFDAASIERLGGLADRLSAAPVSIVLDHHASNDGFGRISLIDPTAAATSVLSEQLLQRLGVQLNEEIAECLYVALATDTGSFKFDMTTPGVHEMAARLIATGIRPGDISRRIFDTRPFGAMKLVGEVIGRAALDPTAAGGRGLVWTYATLADLQRFEQRPYVLETLIDPVRSVAEADVAVVVKQTAENEWAVSLRSKGAVDVSGVAIALGGGGHRLAAGFTGRGELDDVLAAIRGELPASP